MSSPLQVTEELASLFALFDRNGDGVMTSAEVEQVLNALGGLLAPAEAESLRRLMQGQDAVDLPAFLQARLLMSCCRPCFRLRPRPGGTRS